MKKRTEYKLIAKVHSSVEPMIYKKGGRKFYNISLQVYPGTESMDEVVEVEYFLHPTFKKPIIRSTGKKDHFRIMIKAWGIFDVKFKLYFKDGSTKILQQHLKEYLIKI